MYVHEVLVNRLGGLSLPRKSVVRLTDRPDMTLDVYHGRKTTMIKQSMQENNQEKDPLSPVHLFNATSELDVNFTVEIKIALTVLFIVLLPRQNWYISLPIKICSRFKFCIFLKTDPCFFSRTILSVSNYYGALN